MARAKISTVCAGNSVVQRKTRYETYRPFLLASLMLGVLGPKEALAQCSASGTVTPGSVIVCSGSQTSIVGQGPGADNVTVSVLDGANVTVLNTNAISLGNNASLTLGSPGPAVGGSASNAPVVVQTTTNSSAGGGNYGDGSNTVDEGSNGLIIVNRNASIIAVGTQQTSEAVNFYGSGNTLINYGLIQGGPSSAIFFQNVNTTAASPRNIVDNFGTIQLLPVAPINPITGTQAVGSYNNVGIDFTNESGAKVIGNLVFQGGDDTVTLNPQSSITGDLDGGAGTNSLTLNASGTSADTFAGQLQNFQSLDKTGPGTWTLTGAIGDHTAGSAGPLAVDVMGGTLVLTGNNAAFDGSIAINPGAAAGVAGPDPTATLEARVQSLPPLITNEGVLLINQVSPDGVASPNGIYAGLIQGSGGLTKIGSGSAVLNGINTYTGPTQVMAGVLAIGDSSHPASALSGGGAISVASGATLGGYGTVAGSVVNAGTIAAGNAVSTFAASPAGTFTIGGNLTNQASINLAGSSIGNTLRVQGNYVGTNATLALNTVYNAGGPLANQSTDRLLILGNASGSTLIQVHGTGPGALTSVGVPTASDGISLVQVAGSSSTGAFALQGGSVNNGTPFVYRLVAYGPGSPNGVAAPSQSLVGSGGSPWDYRLQTAFVSPTGPVAPVTPPVTTPPATTPPATTPPATTPPATTPVTSSGASTTTSSGTSTAASFGPATGTSSGTSPLAPSGASVASGTDPRPEVVAEIPAYITTPTALFNSGFEELDSLHRRLGEIRLDPGRGPASGETFIRVLGGRFDYTTNRTFNEFGYNSTQAFDAIQAGASVIAVNNADGTLRAGGAVTDDHMTFSPKAIDGPSNGGFNSLSLAGMATWQDNSGWYVDGVLMVGDFKGHITVPVGPQTTELKGSSTSISLEAGYPIDLGTSGASIEPQIQLVKQDLKFERVTDFNGIDVNLGDVSQGVFRGGVRLVDPSVDAEGLGLTPYLKANLLQGLGGGNSILLGNVPFATGVYGTSFQVGGGVTATETSNLSLYGDGAWQTRIGNGAGLQGWAFSAGLRYRI